MSDTADSGLLACWLKAHSSVDQPDAPVMDSGLRFAFYGRTSTTEYQDPATSKSWQLEAARGLVIGCGEIVAEFFDVGCSRREPWLDRPQAAALLAAIARPDPGFDAIVVGEYERAFAAGQFDEMAAVFERHGVQVWLPEANGPGGDRQCDAPGADGGIGCAVAAGGVAGAASGASGDGSPGR